MAEHLQPVSAQPEAGRPPGKGACAGSGLPGAEPSTPSVACREGLMGGQVFVGGDLTQ